MCSSASTSSAGVIQASRRSLTSSAISPSPKLGCTRRLSITPLAPRPAWSLGPQKLVVELADRFDRPLELLIVVQPAANLGHPRAPHAHPVLWRTTRSSSEPRTSSPVTGRASSSFRRARRVLLRIIYKTESHSTLRVHRYSAARINLSHQANPRQRRQSRPISQFPASWPILPSHQRRRILRRKVD